MGKARITSDLGSGEYQIEIDYGSTVIQQRIDRLDQLIATHTQTIDVVEQALDSLSQQANEIGASLRSAIGDMRAGLVDAEQQVKTLTEQLSQANALLGEYRTRLSYARVQLADTQVQRDRLASITVIEERTAWCCDFTEDADGEVATLEINGEPPKILVAPGAAPHNASYGQLIDRMAVTPEAAFYNAALLPGWQKYQPTYRVGQIADIDREHDLCTVYLDEAVSSTQGLGINQASALYNVPIEYMTCNAGAFESWDRVVVKFEGQDWTQPKVIGFESNPKLCAPREVAFAIETGNGGYTATSEPPVMYLGYSDPDDDVYSTSGTTLFMSSTFTLPPGGYANFEAIEPQQVFGTGFWSDAIIRFDLAMERYEKDYFGKPGAGGNSIVRDLPVEDYESSTVVVGNRTASMNSPAVGPNLFYFSDNRSGTTVQNGDGEDVTIAVGTVERTYERAVVNVNGVDIYADEQRFSSLMLGVYNPPQTIVIEYNGKRCQYKMKLMGPVIDVQNANNLFLYIPSGSSNLVQRAFKQFLWITYEYDQVLPDAP